MKKFLVMILVLLLAACCAAEGVYDALEMTATRETVASGFGKLTENGEYFEIGDALVSFWESGRLQAKIRAFENAADAAALTGRSFDAVLKLKQGAPVDKLISDLGEGTEIMMINLADEDKSGVRKVLAWKHEDGTVLEALLEMDSGEWVLFALTVIEG